MMATDLAAVCPHCRSPLLEQTLHDEDVWETMIAFDQGDSSQPLLYRPHWIKGDDHERVTGCLSCGARFDVDQAPVAPVDLDQACAELDRVASAADPDWYITTAPSDIASCFECGNGHFIIELTRTRSLAAICTHTAEEEEVYHRRIVSAEIDIESILCDECGLYQDADELTIDQIAPRIHPNQLQFPLAGRRR